MKAIPTVVVRNLPEERHRALKVRAAQPGRSTEAEIRAILETSVWPPERIRLGTALAELGRRVGLGEENVAVLEEGRGRTPAEPMRLA